MCTEHEFDIINQIHFAEKLQCTRTSATHFPSLLKCANRPWSLCPFARALPGRAENDQWSLMISRLQSFQSNEKGLHVLFIYAPRFERKRKEARIKFNFRMLYTTIRVYVIWNQRCTPLLLSLAPISIKTTFYLPEVWMLSCTMIQAPDTIKFRWNSRLKDAFKPALEYINVDSTVTKCRRGR